MGISLIKFAAPIKQGAQLLYALVADQTRIELNGKHSDKTRSNVLLVENDSTDMGLLVFGITTRSRYSVEILKIAIDYSIPLQLMDPKKMGFFQAVGSGDERFPFRLVSEQRFQLRSMLMHAFALIAQFPPGIRQVPARISVHARTIRTLTGGVESVGRTQITSNLYRIVLADDRLLGINIPPNHSLTTIQPFLIQCGLTASGYGANSSALVRERFNGATESPGVAEHPGTNTDG